MSPFPWSTGTDEDSNIVYDANLNFVCDVAGDSGDVTRETANAEAIARLPELLDSARRFCKEFGNLPDDESSDFHDLDSAWRRLTCLIKQFDELEA